MMKIARIFNVFAFPIVSALLLAAPLVRAQLIANPSFETNTFTVSPGYASGNGGVINAWTYVGGVGLNPAGGNPFADNGVTPNGTKVAFLQSGGNVEATLSAIIFSVTAGVKYNVSFRANSRAATAAPNASWSLDRGAFVPFTASPAVGVGNPYYTVSGSFTATSDTASLVVRNQTAADSALLVDDFRIVVAPVPGALEAFNPNLTATFVSAAAVQLDGKIIIGGTFTAVGGVARANLARLNADGSLDPSFSPTTNEEVDCIAVQADGKILIGGDFTQVNGTARTRLARLHPDGSLESTATFNPGTGADRFVSNLAVQADGKILLSGFFTTFNGASRRGIARLNADGSLESTTTFDPGGGANSIPPGLPVQVSGVAVQPDGKILVVGDFNSFNGVARNFFVRLNADGSLESTATFNPGAGPNQPVRCVAVQPDGKILLGGEFTQYSGVAISRIARLEGDGTLENVTTWSYAGGSGRINSLALQADGKIVVVGDFPGHIARIQANGNAESATTFNPGSGANGIVYGVTLQADGKILLGGVFSTLAGGVRQKVARLTNDPAPPQSVSAPDFTQVLWTRSGSAPEVGPVTFELSTDGGTVWAPLGAGTRVGTSPNWRCTGLSLPPNGQIRARGRARGGFYNGSSGLVETVGSFTLPGITVSQGGVVLPDAGSVSFGTVVTGSGQQLTISIRNTGSTPLTGLTVTKSGTGSASYSVSSLSATSIPVGGSPATFTVTLSSTTGGLKSAALQIASNLTGGLNPYDIQLTGRVLAFSEDTDGDGLSDASEFQLAALGFDWQVSQAALVNALFSNTAGLLPNLNAAGYYTTAQIQALNVDVPLLQRAPGTGVFTLTVGLQKSTNLATPNSFVPFPFTSPGTVINGQGKIEFQFTAPDNAAFYRLEAP